MCRQSSPIPDSPMTSALSKESISPSTGCSMPSSSAPRCALVDTFVPVPSSNSSPLSGSSTTAGGKSTEVLTMSSSCGRSSKASTSMSLDCGSASKESTSMSVVCGSASKVSTSTASVGASRRLSGSLVTFLTTEGPRTLLRKKPMPPPKPVPTPVALAKRVVSVLEKSPLFSMPCLAKSSAAV